MHTLDTGGLPGNGSSGQLFFQFIIPMKTFQQEYSHVVARSYRDAVKSAKANIALHHALFRQLAELNTGLRRMEELIQQKSRTLMSSLSRTL